jgi:hypothetical protein
MFIFLSTQDTGFEQSNPKLISLAIVPMDGVDSFYAEIEMGDGWLVEECDEFVQDEVLPELKGGEYLVTKQLLKTQLLRWVEGLQHPVMAATEASRDFLLLKDLLGQDWPENLLTYNFDILRHDLCQEFKSAVYGYYSDEHRPNNALSHARALCLVYKTRSLRNQNNGHRRLDEMKLLFAKYTLASFDLPTIRKHSLANLARWKAQGTWNSGYTEWERLMSRGSNQEIIFMMTSEVEEPANRLRQSSCWVGLMPESVRQAILKKDPNEPLPSLQELRNLNLL